MSAFANTFTTFSWDRLNLFIIIVMASLTDCKLEFKHKNEQTKNKWCYGLSQWYHFPVQKKKIPCRFKQHKLFIRTDPLLLPPPPPPFPFFIYVFISTIFSPFSLSLFHFLFFFSGCCYYSFLSAFSSSSRALHRNLQFKVTTTVSTPSRMNEQSCILPIVNLQTQSYIHKLIYQRSLYLFFLSCSNSCFSTKTGRQISPVSSSWVTYPKVCIPKGVTRTIWFYSPGMLSCATRCRKAP